MSCRASIAQLENNHQQLLALHQQEATHCLDARIALRAPTLCLVFHQHGRLAHVRAVQLGKVPMQGLLRAQIVQRAGHHQAATHALPAMLVNFQWRVRHRAQLALLDKRLCQVARAASVQKEHTVLLACAQCVHLEQRHYCAALLLAHALLALLARHKR